MKYFLDNSMSPQFEPMLQALGVDVQHVRSIDGMRRDAPDTEWIPIVAARRWVAIGGDYQILRKPSERRCVLENGLIYFVFSSGFPQQDKWVQALAVVRAWPKIAALAARAEPKQCSVVTWSSAKIERFDVRI